MIRLVPRSGAIIRITYSQVNDEDYRCEIFPLNRKLLNVKGSRSVPYLERYYRTVRLQMRISKRSFTYTQHLHLLVGRLRDFSCHLDPHGSVWIEPIKNSLDNGCLARPVEEPHKRERAAAENRGLSKTRTYLVPPKRRIFFLSGTDAISRFRALGRGGWSLCGVPEWMRCFNVNLE